MKTKKSATSTPPQPRKSRTSLEMSLDEIARAERERVQQLEQQHADALAAEQAVNWENQQLREKVEQLEFDLDVEKQGAQALAQDLAEECEAHQRTKHLAQNLVSAATGLARASEDCRKLDREAERDASTTIRRMRVAIVVLAALVGAGVLVIASLAGRLQGQTHESVSEPVPNQTADSGVQVEPLPVPTPVQVVSPDAGPPPDKPRRTQVGGALCRTLEGTRVDTCRAGDPLCWCQ